MKEQLNQQPSAMTDDEAIDAIYAMLHAEREPLEYQPVGNYGFVNPGPKDIHNSLMKLDRKTRSRTDAQQNFSMAEVIDNHFHQKADELFDQLSDWSRFAIIIPNYKAAPATIAHFLTEFGGQIDIHDNDDYQAIHQHTTYKDVNLEFQFHTLKHAQLKKATDIFYHNYVNIPRPKNSAIEQTYNEEQAELIKSCKIVYGHSDFKEALPAVNDIVDVYTQRTKGQMPKQPKLSHFCEYVCKAEKVQNELADYLPKFLERLNQMDKTVLVTEKTKN